MDEKEFRVLIKHYFMKGKTPHETKEKLDKHYGDSAPSIRQILLFGRDQQTRAALDAVYKPKRRLC
uniref:Mos1 transposase HTH domain-containing protein n=1 Tax=Rhodnius prolixus TaxID=13249 RepID=T1IEP9_RHOPR